ncbi:MAG: type III pantothenate kinase [Clostridiales bacterium]|nr:type III pantothenate kinase [Clostridiales bacterium]
MILAIDIGNSTTSVGLFDMRGTLLFRSDLSTSKHVTRDQCAISLMGVFQLYGAVIGAVTSAIVASVVPPITAAMAEAVTLLIGKAPLIVGPGIKTGLNIKADMHTQMGADIVSSSVAAAAKYPTPVIVVDMGTAVTMSVIVGNTYEGCVIMPGVRTALEALSDRAAELPHISLERPASILGRNTIDAMRSGVLYGNAAMLDNMISYLEEASAPAAAVVATGGNASTILPYCKRKIQYDQNLLMDGLYLLCQKNAERNRK